LVSEGDLKPAGARPPFPGITKMPFFQFFRFLRSREEKAHPHVFLYLSRPGPQRGHSGTPLERPVCAAEKPKLDWNVRGFPPFVSFLVPISKFKGALNKTMIFFAVFCFPKVFKFQKKRWGQIRNRLILGPPPGPPSIWKAHPPLKAHGVAWPSFPKSTGFFQGRPLKIRKNIFVAPPLLMYQN